MGALIKDKKKQQTLLLQIFNKNPRLFNNSLYPPYDLHEVIFGANQNITDTNNDYIPFECILNEDRQHVLPLHQGNSPSLKVQVLYMSLMVDEDLKNKNIKIYIYSLKDNVL